MGYCGPFCLRLCFYLQRKQPMIARLLFEEPNFPTSKRRRFSIRPFLSIFETCFGSPKTGLGVLIDDQDE